MTRLVIDPVTRIGGQLRLEAEVAGGAVTDAWSAGTMFRGVELVLRGRDPRDAWLVAQRVCGTCGTAHALASVRAVEAALGVTVPRNARLVRNLITGTRFVQDHVVNFYHRHAIDWVDLDSAAGADPAEASRLARTLSAWPQSSAEHFRTARDRLAAAVRDAQGGPYANGYWGHPAYRLSPAANLVLAAHYLEALDWQRRITKLHVLLGGKDPHPQTFLVGGMALAPAWGGPRQVLSREHPMQVDRTSLPPLSSGGLASIREQLSELRTFVDQVYVPDVRYLAGEYREWAGIGKGAGDYLAYGEFPEDDMATPVLLLPRGRIVAGDLVTVAAVDEAAVAESVAHAHYAPATGDDDLAHPFAAETTPRYGGPRPPYTTLAGADRYSWLKAPRYDGRPMEVGPLARMLVAYVEGRTEVRRGIDAAAAVLGGGLDALTGTLGRILARAVEAQVLASRLDGWLGELGVNLASGDQALVELTTWDPGAWPADLRGVSLGESPRGALGHWVRIHDRRVAGYQIVDGSTWNGSPRDARGRRGPWEAALIGTPVADPRQPLEILRTVHSFDPCAACAVHAVGIDSGSLRVRTTPGEAGR